MKKNLLLVLLCTLVFLNSICSRAFGEDIMYGEQVEKLQNWLLINRDQATGLPHSHVGDERFQDWALTYDSAVTICAYIANGKIEEAKRIADFYIHTPSIWRLGGIIEAVNPNNPVLGEDWSVRTGSNLWMGIAGFRLYKATRELKYLELAKKLADFSISLQNKDRKDFNYGGIRLGPLGGPNVANDQHINYDINQPAFYDVYATEHNIDAYSLFNLLYHETKELKYRNARDKVLTWFKKVAYNRKEHRFNRGYTEGKIDTAIAADIHSWAISALGSKVLNTFEPSFAKKIIQFIENNCLSEAWFTKPDGSRVNIKGVDFIDRKTASRLGREPLVSPEWTFQLVNAYRSLELDFTKRRDNKSTAMYREKRQELIKNMLDLAIENDNTLAYPYATQANVIIGHEYKTPQNNNLSTIGVAYAILALVSYDPLTG